MWVLQPNIWSHIFPAKISLQIEYRLNSCRMSSLRELRKSAAPRTNSRLFNNTQLLEVLAALLATTDFFVVGAWIFGGGFCIAQNPPVSSNQGPARKPRLSKASRHSTTQGLASPESRDSSPRLPPLPPRLFGGAALQLALADWLLLARSPGWRERGSLLEADWVRLRTC